MPFPDIFVGNYKNARVAYCCAYGAARAVEPSQIFAQLGTPLLIQIGTCGVMSPRIAAGTVAIPLKAAARDGVSQCYGASGTVDFSANWSHRADQSLRDIRVATRCTRHVTRPSLFAQSDEICARWASEGLETVDMPQPWRRLQTDMAAPVLPYCVAGTCYLTAAPSLILCQIAVKLHWIAQTKQHTKPPCSWHCRSPTPDG